MNPRSVLVPVGFLLGLASAATALGNPLADIVSAEKRRSIVELAQLLTRPPRKQRLLHDHDMRDGRWRGARHNRRRRRRQK